MTDHDNLAAGLIFGGLEPAEEVVARDLERQDPQFAALVAHYGETAAFLAKSDLPEAPSAHISDKILAVPDEIDRPDPRPADDELRDESGPNYRIPVSDGADSALSGVASLDAHRRENSRWKRTALALGGVAAAVATGFGIVVMDLVNERGDLREEVADVQSEFSDLNRLMQAEDLTVGQAALPGDEAATITVMASVDESLVRVQTANVTIPAGEDMQMWLISDDGAEPMGVIDTSNPGVDSLPIPAGAELGFTMEQEGGSEELQGPPVVSIKL